MSRTQHRLPPMLVPNKCIMLAIDPGRRSGWAIIEPSPSGTELWLLDHGECNGASSVPVGLAQLRAELLGMPLVVVAERWSAGNRSKDKRMNARTIAGLGAAWGAWEHVLREAGHPRRRTLRVLTQRWRAAVIGGAQRKSELWKAAAQAQVRHRFKVEVGTDAAEAILIGTWGMYAGEVAAVLPKRRAA